MPTLFRGVVAVLFSDHLAGSLDACVCFSLPLPNVTWSGGVCFSLPTWSGAEFPCHRGDIIAQPPLKKSFNDERYVLYVVEY